MVIGMGSERFVGREESSSEWTVIDRKNTSAKNWRGIQQFVYMDTTICLALYIFNTSQWFTVTLLSSIREQCNKLHL